MKTDDPHSQDANDLREKAKRLYFQAYRIPDIAAKLGVNEFTVYSWRRRDKWDSTSEAVRVHDCAAARMVQL